MEKENEIVAVEENNLMDLSEFTPKQIRFLHLYLSGTYTHGEIANILNIHVNTCHNWLRIPKLREYIQKYQVEEQVVVKDKLNMLTNKAVSTMVDLMDSPMDGVRYQAAKDILDRAGHNTSQKMEIKKEVYNYDDQIRKLTAEVIDEIDDEEIIKALGDIDEE